MKIYLLLFALLVNFEAFGQDSTVITYADYCTNYLLSPNQNLFHNSIFSNNIYTISNRQQNHFQILFPGEKMKENGIKSIFIKKEDTDGTPTIHIRQYDINTYRLNDDGYVIVFEKGFQQKINYERDKNNLIIIQRDSSFSDGTRFGTRQLNRCETSQYLYNPEGKLTSISKTDNIKTLRTTYSYDYKNRLLKVSKEQHFIRKDDEIESIKYIYQYNDKKHIRTTIKSNSSVNIDTLFYDAKWRPIIRNNYNLKNELTDNHQLIYSTQNPSSEEKIETFKDIKKGKISNYGSYQLEFHYKSNGLLEKIIQITDDGTCEYQVYYYTE